MTSSRPSSLTVERADPMTRCPTTCLKDQTTNTIVESCYSLKLQLFTGGMSCSRMPVSPEAHARHRRPFSPSVHAPRAYIATS